MANGSRPALVIVTGAPASGKSSLAEELGKRLRSPVLSRDAIKEPLMDQPGTPDGEGSHLVGGAAYAVLYVILDKLLAAGVSAIAESNFTRGEAEQYLQPLVDRARAVQLVCETSAAEIAHRYKERDEEGDRHPGHESADPATLADLGRSVRAGQYDPLDLDIPLLEIDTTNGFSPSLDDIAEFVRRNTGRQQPAGSPT
jgi:predicted kinase